MREISIDELKNVQIDILDYVKEICEKNNLRYFLCGGTLLGAVRHKGYIPWDDDIDVYMPMKDYKKFIELGKLDKKYTIMEPYNNELYDQLFCKVSDNRTCLIEDGCKDSFKIGVNIDVFPLCGFPDDYIEAVEYCNKMNDIYKKYNIYGKRNSWNYSVNPIKKVLKTIFKYPLYIKNRKLKNKLINMMEKYDSDTAKYLGYALSWYTTKEIIDRKEFDDLIDIEFENKIYKAPVGFDKYLSNLYGSYMELPPVEKRVSHHNFNAWWLN